MELTKEIIRKVAMGLAHLDSETYAELWEWYCIRFDRDDTIQPNNAYMLNQYLVGKSPAEALRAIAYNDGTVEPSYNIDDAYFKVNADGLLISSGNARLLLTDDEQGALFDWILSRIENGTIPREMCEMLGLEGLDK